MKKPGYKSVQFWLTTIAMGVAVVVSTGVAGTDAEPTAFGKLVAIGTSLLMAAGYAVKRGAIKKGDPEKKWYATTEWWLSVAAIAVGILAASGAFGVDSTAAKIVGGAGTLLAMLGYGQSRSAVKSSAPAGAMQDLK